MCQFLFASAYYDFYCFVFENAAKTLLEAVWGIYVACAYFPPCNVSTACNWWAPIASSKRTIGGQIFCIRGRAGHREMHPETKHSALRQRAVASAHTQFSIAAFVVAGNALAFVSRVRCVSAFLTLFIKRNFFAFERRKKPSSIVSRMTII